MMKLLRMNSILLIAVLIVTSCGNSYEEQKRLSKAERYELFRKDSLALKIAVMPTLDCMPVYVASACRLFDTLKVDVNLKRYNAQMDCDTAVANGRVEGLFTDLVRAQRLKNRNIALDYITSTNAYWQLITNRMARLKQLNQLGDKMIAMTRYSVTDYLTDRSLDTVKTKAQVFRVQINDVVLRLRMLQNNEMDAMWLPEPQATNARIDNNPVIRDSRDFKVQMGVLAFRSKAMKDKHRQGQLKAFIKAYNMAVDSLNKNGLQHYSALITKYCGSDAKTIKALPEMKFTHICRPRTIDIDKAKKY